MACERSLTGRIVCSATAELDCIRAEAIARNVISGKGPVKPEDMELLNAHLDNCPVCKKSFIEACNAAHIEHLLIDLRAQGTRAA